MISMTKIGKEIIHILLLLVLLTGNLLSQNVFNSIVDERISKPLKFPWAGGMDAIQFCDVDFNMDGKMDLLAFDRRGNRKICFINDGEDYVYAPFFAKLLPDFFEWVIFADYNMDGKNDIFTYSPGYGSMMVYKNVSTTDLQFKRVVYPYLKTLLPGGYVNLFVTNADYPGIADVDNDGDLDILTFGVLGSFIGMHKNMSMEKYGTPDSLDFEHTSYCWGHVAESDESNILYFDTCVPGTYVTEPIVNRKDRHTGSTLLLQDLDNNGLVDLLLGDVDYPGLFALYNTGSTDDAFIYFADTLFPQGTNNINLFSMPVAAYTDVNNDDIKDLLVSPFDPGIITSQNKNSSWLYLNSGSDTNPVFELQETDFLQSEMIDVGSGAYPVIYDWDNDGLDDLFVGNYGYYSYSYYENYFLHSVYYSQIAYFKNIGTILHPEFELVDEDFAGLSSLHEIGLAPTFGDINGDGSPDLLLGNSEGKIIYVSYNKLKDEFDIVTKNYLDIDVGQYSYPQLFDLNVDGINDLIIGEKGGNINYYENFGEVGAPDFVFVTDSLGKINVTDYSVSWNGYSTPSFFTDNNLNTGLLVGSEQGMIYYFTDIDNNIDGKFTESNKLDILLDTSNVNFDRGMRTGATICNMFENNKLEMIVGNYSGGLEYYNGTANVLYDDLSEIKLDGLDIYPNPASEEVILKFNETNGIADITLYNVVGMEITSNRFNIINSSITFNLSTVHNGVYFIVSKVGQSIYKNKIIVVKK